MTLTAPQREAISRYIGGAYVRINGDCRGDSDGDPRIWRDIYLLDEALAEAFLQEDQIVYRGVDKAYAAELERRLASAGDSLIDKAFLSTSRSKVVARGFLGYEEGGLLMKIRVPQG